MMVYTLVHDRHEVEVVGRRFRWLLGDVVEQCQQRGVLVTRRHLAARQDAADVLDHAHHRSRSQRRVTCAIPRKCYSIYS